jgi:1,4-alpha-glucan branching enzyme
MVSRPTSIGGLGFGMKWMMGWIPFLKHFKKYHQNETTFSITFQKLPFTLKHTAACLFALPAIMHETR